MPVNSVVRVRVAGILVACVAIAVIALAGCAAPKSGSAPVSTGSSAASSTSGSSDASSAAGSTTADSVYTPAYVPNGNEVAVIKTDKGTIRVKLYGKDAPINTGNFIELAQKGFYNGTRFHRLEAGFVLQGGDPQTKKLSKNAVVKLVGNQANGVFAQGQPMLGTGGPGYVIKGEFAADKIVHKHLDGTLAMARTDSPDSAGSQFYFALAPLPELDGKYTVFGDTTQGLSVVHELGVGDAIRSITIENVSR